MTEGLTSLAGGKITIDPKKINEFRALQNSPKSVNEPDWNAEVEKLFEHLKKEHYIKAKREGGSELLWEQAEKTIKLRKRAFQLKKEGASSKEKLEAEDEPTSMEEVKKRLKLWGDQWRLEHTSDESTKSAEVDSRSVIDILYKVVNFALILPSENVAPKEIDKLPLSYYNLDSGLWQSDSTTLDQFILIIEPRIVSEKKWKDIIATMRAETTNRIVETTDRNLIAVNNGVFDRNAKKLLPFSPKYGFVKKIKTDFKEDIDGSLEGEPEYSGWKLSKWFWEDVAIHDEKKCKLLWEGIFAGITSACYLRQALILIDTGGGRKGKGTYQNIITNIRGGTSTIADVTLDKFSDPNALAQAYGKGLIIGDDNDPHSFMAQSKAFKGTVSNDPVTIKILYKDIATVNLNCFVIQSCNGFPQIKDSTAANFDRFAFIKFTKSYDPRIRANWNVSHDYIQRQDFKEWVLKHVLTEVDLGIGFTQTEESEQLQQETREESNSVYSFAINVVPELQSTAVTSKFMYELYRVTTLQDGRHPVKGGKSFVKSLSAELEGKWVHAPKNVAVLNDGWNSADYDLYKHSFSGFSFKQQNNAVLDMAELTIRGGAWIKVQN